MPYFSMMPDYQHRMSLHKEVIQQVGDSSMFDYWTSTTIIGFLLCLSMCQKAHITLLQPYVVEGVIRIFEMSNYNPLKNKSVDLMEVQTTTCVILIVLFTSAIASNKV